MHEQVIQFVRAWLQDWGLDKIYGLRVLDIGGRKTSTSKFYSGPQPYELIPDHSAYLILDITPGDDVDIIADATHPAVAERLAKYPYDLVICTEVLEHVKNWPAILETAWYALKPEGYLIVTCAAPGRRPHPATSEDWDPPPGEHYENVSHMDIREELIRLGFRDVLTFQRGYDSQAVARR